VTIPDGVALHDNPQRSLALIESHSVQARPDLPAGPPESRLAPALPPAARTVAGPLSGSARLEWARHDHPRQALLTFTAWEYLLDTAAG
jgi:hypothetical protein